MSLRYYSVAAYKYVREFFNNHLPSMRTMQLWYSSIEGGPGICEAALNIIREKSEAYLTENKHPLHLTLIYDDVSIRKGLHYSVQKQSFEGFATYINTSKKNDDEESSHAKLAKDALVYMVVGKDFKVPIAYELCAGLDSIDRAALTLKVIKAIEATGAVIISLTGDGLKGNKTAAEHLGANFEEGRPYFQSPTHPEQKIYVIFDPPHMLKLVRKHFSSNMIYHNDKLVNWKLLEILVNKQSVDNFNLCNKLTKLHMNWNQKPMNVMLATETISNSVANALQQLCKDGYDEFKDCETTTEFLRYFNSGFDVLNFGADEKKDNKYKQALNPNSAAHIFDFAEKFKQYISELEFRTPKKTCPILKSSVMMGFLGFYCNMISIRGIYEDFILNGPLEEFQTFQFSQDHIETFFSLIR